jgi:endonuclease YncB( thermonuclease family)
MLSISTHIRIVIGAITLSTLLSSHALAVEVKGRAEIVDGDTLEIGDVIVRLYGIDAAETGQRCIDKSRKIIRPGELAAERIMTLAADSISCSGTEYDDYGRLIGVCSTSDGVVLNETLVSEGLAWAFVKFSDEYVAQERQAKSAHLGVWALACEEPWVFRHKRWEVTKQKAPNGCPIKGNISNNGHIYHTPWSRHYANTKVTESKGERWFCSEGEALAAGFRPPKR